MSNSKIIVRDLSMQDISSVIDIAVAQDVGGSERVNKYFSESILSERRDTFVAEVDSQVVGMIGWYIDDGSWAGESLGKVFPYGENVYWVNYFAVSNDFQRKGIGSILVEGLLKNLNEIGATELWTYTTRAKGFYQKMGFEYVTNTIIEEEPHDFLKYTF